MNQPMTIKARAAINAFVANKLNQQGQTVDNCIRFTLQADRMKRDTLYTWLEDRGYRWRSKARAWVLSTRKVAK